jgi:hypothetical protein
MRDFRCFRRNRQTYRLESPIGLSAGKSIRLWLDTTRHTTPRRGGLHVVYLDNQAVRSWSTAHVEPVAGNKWIMKCEGQALDKAPEAGFFGMVEGAACEHLVQMDGMEV